MKLNKRSMILESLKSIKEVTKTFTIKDLANFVAGILTKYGGTKPEVQTASQEKDDFLIQIKYTSAKEIDKSVTDKISNEIVSKFPNLPISSVGGGLGVDVIDQKPMVKGGFLVDLEIYN